jgi:glycosyltransferase involved in cell wall biosynthesis
MNLPIEDQNRAPQVCMVVRWFHPHMTGVVTQYRQLGPQLKKRGVDFRVHTAITELAVGETETLEGITIRRYKVLDENEKIRVNELDIRLLKESLKTWKQQNKYPDAVILLGVTTEVIPQLMELRNRGVKLILTLTIFPEFEAPIKWYTKSKWKIETFLHFFFFDEIIIHSSTFVSLYKTIGISRRKLHILPFPVDCEKFYPCLSLVEKSELRSRLHLNEEGLIILFMGSVIERKGADLLLKAWLRIEKKYPNCKLVFVGPYGKRETLLTESLRAEHDRFLERFQGMLDSLENRDSVILTGTINNPQDYFRAADIFAFPSLLEGMGGVIPEAMACQLPCVLTRFEGFPEEEFGRADHEFLQADFTAESIANALESLLESPERRAFIGTNALHNARKTFNLPLIADKLVEVCLGPQT